MGRPAEITRQGIMEVALQLADQGGARALTIRKIAAQLSVTPMAVYRHVADKQAILHGMLDEVIRQHLHVAYLQEPPGPWLLQTLCDIRRALVKHPVVLALVGEPQSFGSQALGVGEQLLAALHAAGLAPARTAEALNLLVSYTLGAAALASAAESLGDSPQGRWTAHMEAEVEQIQAVDLPNIILAAPHLVRLPTDEAFKDGLQLLLRALGIDPG